MENGLQINVKFMKSKLKVLYVGTGSFAIDPFEGLLAMDEVEIVGIVTQPDRPAGRKKVLTPGPLKQHLLDSEYLSDEIKLYQPEKLRSESEDILDKTDPDLVVVAAYGQMIPDDILLRPEYGAWNLHGSLLPELRGAIPIQMAILQGLKETGVTIQQMVAELDAGDILQQESLSIDPEETSETLMGKASDLAKLMLESAIQQLLRGNLEPVAQDDSQATFCYQKDISKAKAELTSFTEAVRAERMVRAFNPWPIAWFILPEDLRLGGKRVQVYKSQLVDIETPADEFLFTDAKNLYLNLSGGVLELLEIKLEGKQLRSGVEYLYLVEK